MNATPKTPKAKAPKSDYSKAKFNGESFDVVTDAMDQILEGANLLQDCGFYHESFAALAVYERCFKVHGRLVKRAKRRVARMEKRLVKAAELVKAMKDAGMTAEEIVTKLVGE